MASSSSDRMMRARCACTYVDKHRKMCVHVCVFGTPGYFGCTANASLLQIAHRSNINSSRHSNIVYLIATIERIYRVRYTQYFAHHRRRRQRRSYGPITRGCIATANWANWAVRRYTQAHALTWHISHIRTGESVVRNHKYKVTIICETSTRPRTECERQATHHQRRSTSGLNDFVHNFTASTPGAISPVCARH